MKLFFHGEKMKKSATWKVLAFCGSTEDHQILKVQYFRQWQYSQSVCQRASKFRTEGRKSDPKVGNEPSLRGLQIGHWSKLVVWQNSDFFGKNWDFGHKNKRSLLRIHHEWPERAKNRGEPRKMTPSLETEIFSGWSEWESCGPGYTCDMPHWQKSRWPYKKLTWPIYQKFWVKKAHFRP